MELVTVKDNVVFCDSSMVAKKFNVKHNDVTKKIERLLVRLRGANVSPKVSPVQKSYRGQEFTAYLMDREFFTLLGMRFESKTALEWQIKFNEAFFKMELTIEDSSKPSSIMDEINECVKLAESDKDKASLYGKGLSEYKKRKKINSVELKKLINEVQYTLGFED